MTDFERPIDDIYNDSIFEDFDTELYEDFTERVERQEKVKRNNDRKIIIENEDYECPDDF